MLVEMRAKAMTGKTVTTTMEEVAKDEKKGGKGN